MEIYKEMRNLDGHDSQRSSQELGDDITGCSRPGRLTSCWTVRGKPGNLDQFLIVPPPQFDSQVSSGLNRTKRITVILIGLQDVFGAQ